MSKYPMVRTAGIICKHDKPEAWDAAERLAAWLTDRGISSLVDPDTASYLDMKPTPKEFIPDKADVIVVFGGDGTLLSVAAAREYVELAWLEHAPNPARLQEWQWSWPSRETMNDPRTRLQRGIMCSMPRFNILSGRQRASRCRRSLSVTAGSRRVYFGEPK